MRFLIFPVCLLALFSSCKKQEQDNAPLVSSIAVKKNGTQWPEITAVGTFNTSDSIISVVASKDTETFTIRFKKPVLNPRIETFEASSLFAPFSGSAALSDRYTLDSTKSNMLRILLIENIKKRIAGDFYLHLKRDEKYGGKEAETTIYQGRFDVQYEDLAF